MQPFGLFNLLKSALFSDETTPDSSANSEKEEANSTPKSELKNPQTTSQTPPQTPPNEKPNACSDFLLRHEARANRRKKS